MIKIGMIIDLAWAAVERVVLDAAMVIIVVFVVAMVDVDVFAIAMVDIDMLLMGLLVLGWTVFAAAPPVVSAIPVIMAAVL